MAFLCLAPNYSTGVTKESLPLGEEMNLWHPEIFRCLRRPGDYYWLKNLSPDSVFPELQAHSCFETPLFCKPLLTWHTESNTPCSAGIWFTSYMNSVSCPDGNTMIQACSWILCYTKSWNNKLSSQKQVQCHSRAATEHAVYMLFPCLITRCGLRCFFLPSPIMCSEKMD